MKDIVGFLGKHFSGLSEILQLILFVTVPTLLLLVYTRQHVDMALIKRQMHKLNLEKKELQSRNQALKEAIGKLARKRRLRYWQSYQGFAPYEKSKIVRIKLPPPLKLD